jgi:hypothetical protein
MSLKISSSVLNGMGFRQIAQGEILNAAFHGIYIYELRGITLDDSVLHQIRGIISGVAYTGAVGKSIKDVYESIIDDELETDEDEWAEEHHCLPPYIVLHFGPTAMHQCTEGHVKEEGTLLVTYDSFAKAKFELRSIVDKALPSLITSLTCCLSSFDHYVNIVLLDQRIYGITSDGRFLKDEQFQLSASGYTSYKFTSERLQTALVSASSLAASINPKVSRLFHLAMEEKDQLKRFLFLFLVIEIETHATFTAIDHCTHISRIVNSEDRIRLSSMSFFESQPERWINLKDRFIWCALCKWKQITDTDVDDFKRLKKVRDDIAHGSLSEPPPDAVNSAKRLSMKLLQSGT